MTNGRSAAEVHGFKETTDHRRSEEIRKHHGAVFWSCVYETKLL